MLTSLIGFVALFVLLLFRVPIGFGMILVGVAGFAYLTGWGPALSMAGQLAYDTTLSYSLTVVPLFVLMGNLVTQSGLSHELYRASYAMVGHLRGGLAFATLISCAGFSSISGSSLATAATMSKVAMPSMRQYGYADSIAAGTIAAGGTLGILIPPSIILVLYGIMTETDIGQLFAAGIVPGLLGLGLYMSAVWLITTVRPRLGPRGERWAWGDRWRAMRGVWGVLVLFILVMGGIYFGIFTPTEAAGIGASGAFFFALLRRALTWAILRKVLLDSAATSAMIFVILIGALMFSNFVNVAGLPRDLTDWLSGLEVSPLTVMLGMLAIYLVLGAILETMSMMLLTLPVFFPLVTGLGFDPVWFGVVLVTIMEIGLVTPPIGLNVFVLNATLPGVPTSKIFAGVTPFLIADIVRLILMLMFPWLVLFLPSLM